MKLKIFYAFFGAACILSIFALLLLSKRLSIADEYMVQDDEKSNNWIRINDNSENNNNNLETNPRVVPRPPRLRNPPPKNLTSPNLHLDHMPYSRSCPIEIDYAPRASVQMLDVYDSLKFDNPDGGVWKQGWKVEVDEKMWNAHHKLKVFVVPHSHNDPGWVKTFDEYFRSETKHILDNMVDKLKEDSRRKFIWAEISYFEMWWRDLDGTTRDAVKSLLSKGQLEIVTGGWVMNDEANSHWVATIAQLTEGHLWLKRNLNYTPTSSWSIDPFGMSSTQAVFLKETGMDNMLIQRVHYSIKKEFALKKQLEFYWRQIWDGNGQTDMFTHMMPFYSYDIPHTCGPDPKICCQFDFKRLPGFGLHCPWRVPPEAISEVNVAEKAEILLDQYRKKSTLYKTNVLLIPLGDDFRYVQRNEWDVQFKNYQLLFDYINSKVHLNAHIKFGTLTDYFKALRSESETSIFPSLSGDFFTYADRDDHYWSGYYTSRPLYKRLDRVLLGYVRAAESLATIAILNRKNQNLQFIGDYLTEARRALALFQHHDGITGTAKDYVMKDYGDRMLEAIRNCQQVLQISTKMMLSSDEFEIEDQLTYYNIDDIRTNHLNLPEHYTITIGRELSTKQIVIYNSLSFVRREVVTFVVSTPYVEVSDGDSSIECQISPIFEYGSKIATTKYYLSFIIDIQPFGLETYTISAVEKLRVPIQTNYAKITLLNINDEEILDSEPFGRIETSPNSRAFTIQNSQVTASFNDLGLLKAMKVESKTYPIHLDFASYGAAKRPERSGAYLFLPDKDATPTKIESTLIRIIEGSVLSSVRVQIPYVDHSIYLYNTRGADGLGLEIENTVNIASTNNFELAMRLSTNIKNGDVFFTDSNGYQVIRRKRFKKLPLQANYYPVPTSMYIEDEYARLTLLTSTPVGGSSLKEGMVEVMLDRRLNQDDNLGLGQGVLDNREVRQTFRLVLEASNHNCQTAVDGHPAGFQSLAAHVASETLLNPLLRLLNRNDDYSDPPSRTSEHRTVAPGVDISVPIMRPEFRKNRLDWVGLVAHRTMLDLCYADKAQLEKFPIGNGTLAIGETLPSSVEFGETRRSSLSFTRSFEVIGSFAELCPMETKAFVLRR